MTALAVSNVVLWIVVLALLAVVLALTRQVGVLHERIAPAGALMMQPRSHCGEPVPVIDVTDLNGQALKIGAARSDGLSTLVLFVSPTCPVCESLAAGAAVEPQTGEGLARDRARQRRLNAANSPRIRSRPRLARVP